MCLFMLNSISLFIGILETTFDRNWEATLSDKPLTIFYILCICIHSWRMNYHEWLIMIITRKMCIIKFINIEFKCFIHFPFCYCYNHFIDQKFLILIPSSIFPTNWHTFSHRLQTKAPTFPTSTSCLRNNSHVPCEQSVD